jgi:hypothetical protein
LDIAQAPQWQAALQHEYSSLIDNGTWELVELPPGSVVVNNMWIYTVKSDTAGDVSFFKAWFVAKGCSQRAGLDYTETFSPVIRMASLRLFLAITAARDLELCQLDIDIAFLYAPIKEDVHIRQPLGFNDGTSNGVTSSAASADLSSPLASSTCCSVHGSSTTGGNNASPTRASTSSTLVTCLP